MKRGYAEIAEGQVHYVIDGSGEPLLLLHRSPRSWTFYQRVLPLLARSRRVIAMDTLGFGNSDLAPPDFTLADYAESVVHFLDALGIEKTDIWGSMTGAMIAIELAIRWPQRVRRLVLMGIPMIVTPEEREAYMVVLAKSRANFAPNAGGSFLIDIWKWALHQAHIAPDDQLVPEWMTETVIDAIRAGPGYHQMAFKVHSHNVQARLPLIKAETLVIDLTGKNVSPFIKGDRAKEAQALIPSSRLVTLAGPGAHEEAAYARAKDLVDVVLPFLE